MQNFIKTIINAIQVWTRKEIKNNIPTPQQSDWNQNDPNQINYIQNRPFYDNYDDVKKELIYEKRYIDWKPHNGYDNYYRIQDRYFATDDNSYYEIIPGDDYLLVICDDDGNPINTYSATAIDAGSDGYFICFFDSYGGTYEFEGSGVSYYGSFGGYGTHIKLYHALTPIKTKKISPSCLSSAMSEWFNQLLSNIDLAIEAKANRQDPNFNNSISMQRKYNSTVGFGSTAIGQENIASATYSLAEGWNTQATTDTSATPQKRTSFGSAGQASHAEGYGTVACGHASHAEGNGTKASGGSSHSEGYGTTASGDQSHVEGERTTASGAGSHAEGNYTTASGTSSHAEGGGTNATGDYSHAEGYTQYSNGNNASGKASHVEGINTTASGIASHAEGNGHASGNYSHAEGGGRAEGIYSHAEGSGQASGTASHAEGQGQASGDYSHVEGFNTIAAGKYSHVQGDHNIEDKDGKYAHIVGHGYYNTAVSPDIIHSNIHTLDWEGNAWFAGDVYVGSTSGINKDEGSKKLITLDDIPEVESQVFIVTQESANEYEDLAETIYNVSRAGQIVIFQRGDNIYYLEYAELEPSHYASFYKVSIDGAIHSIVINGSTITDSIYNPNNYIDEAIANKVTVPQDAIAGDLLTYDGSNWVRISKADLISDILLAIEESNKITFYIEGEEYRADKNMTWHDWCNSNYNTSNFGNYYEDERVSDADDHIIYEDEFVHGSDIIIANYGYTVRFDPTTEV